MTPRRQFRLPAHDEAFLDHLGLVWEAIIDGGVMWIIIYAFPLPSGYGVGASDVAIEILPNYPVTPLDMAYFHPTLARVDGRQIPNADSMRAIDGKTWQRWSRHRVPGNAWNPEIDDLDTHLALVADWLEREFRR
jgi:hypothetical protein